ncbi:hypothetical protein [Arthrobacter sp. H14-L1]|uniref:hypothetical protein n=1 Tax=Arthrobacter sp. H14-L1 TaxID=2996697 RepID=UPI00226E9AE4|nr:hypothetical protein [Arthrobacter sp. H14-L1]MCY0905401.1 hypothetical protein [Arthrobacter sp. H14-L1]
MGVYLDTFAALELIVEEPECAVLAERLMEMTRNSERGVASMLLYTELHCAVRRRFHRWRTLEAEGSGPS